MNNYAEVPYSPILPLTLGALPAAVVTALLVLLMHSLIASDVPLIDEEKITIAPIVRVDPDPLEVTIKVPPAVKPVDVTEPPERLTPRSESIPEGYVLASRYKAPAPTRDEGIEIDGGGGGIVAYLKPQPIYPSRPLTQGIEGHVDLAFDIAATGATTNIRVIDAEPQGVFERAAIKALQKWKYKVPVIDDVPQGQVDMMTRMTFRLED